MFRFRKDNLTVHYGPASNVTNGLWPFSQGLMT